MQQIPIDGSRQCTPQRTSLTAAASRHEMLLNSQQFLGVDTDDQPDDQPGPLTEVRSRLCILTSTLTACQQLSHQGV